MKTDSQKLNIFFDARYVDPDRLDGIGRYSLELLKAFAKTHPDVTVLIFSQKQLKRLPPDLHYKLFPPVDSFREIFSVRKLNIMGCDILFSPLFNFAQVIGSRKWFFGLWGQRKFRLILTLHDTFYFQFRTPPSWLKLLAKIIWRAFYLTRWPMRLALNHADAVATVSETSRKEILKLRLTKRPITVIYNAPTDFAKAETASRKTEKNEADFREKTLLYMGSFFGYKNVETLVAALKFLPNDYKLICCSRITDSRREELLKNATPEVRERIKFLNGISDEKYLKFLKNCFAIVSASRSEGFNLQLAEAMAAGTPIVCSDLPVHREVAGGAALFFELSRKVSPLTIEKDARNLAAKVRELEDRKLREKLILTGKRQATKFSWNKSAVTLDQLIRNIAKEKD